MEDIIYNILRNVPLQERRNTSISLRSAFYNSVKAPGYIIDEIDHYSHVEESHVINRLKQVFRDGISIYKKGVELYSIHTPRWKILSYMKPRDVINHWTYKSVVKCCISYIENENIEVKLFNESIEPLYTLPGWWKMYIAGCVDSFHLSIHYSFMGTEEVFHPLTITINNVNTNDESCITFILNIFVYASDNNAFADNIFTANYDIAFSYDSITNKITWPKWIKGCISIPPISEPLRVSTWEDLIMFHYKDCKITSSNPPTNADDYQIVIPLKDISDLLGVKWEPSKSNIKKYINEI